MPRIKNEIEKKIIEIYSKESGIPADSPDFIQKLNKWAGEKREEALNKEPEICPCCGQEIED